MKKLTLLFFLNSLIFACKKEPGVGGNGTITGKIITRHFNATFTTLLGTYPSADHYVYIVYGNNIGYDKRIKTDYNGEFRFSYLYPGKYTIYTYSLDSTRTILSGTVVKKEEVQLSRNQNYRMPDLIIYD